MAGYYKKQNQLVEQFHELESFLERTSGRSDEESRGKTEAEENEERRTQIALQVSFYANIVLLGVKLFAAISSGSLSIITSALDSFLEVNKVVHRSGEGRPRTGNAFSGFATGGTCRALIG